MDTIDTLIQQLKSDEGAVKKHGLHVPYKDHLGYTTIGYGTLIDPAMGGGLTEEEAEYLLMNRVKITISMLQKKLTYWDRLSDARKRALINMAYQLGITKFMKFKNMLRALHIGDYNKAALEALDSRWAKQTPNRAARVANQIKNG